MCVCVVIPFIPDVRFVDVPAGVTKDFSTFILRCLLLFFSREGFSCSFPSSTVKSNLILCPNDLIVGKVPVRVTTPRFELTSQRQKVSKLPTESPGLLVHYVLVQVRRISQNDQERLVKMKI